MYICIAWFNDTMSTQIIDMEQSYCCTGDDEACLPAHMFYTKPPRQNRITHLSLLCVGSKLC